MKIKFEIYMSELWNNPTYIIKKNEELFKNNVFFMCVITFSYDKITNINKFWTGLGLHVCTLKYLINRIFLHFFFILISLKNITFRHNIICQTLNQS